jgi:hypothetical protein
MPERAVAIRPGMPGFLMYSNQATAVPNSAIATAQKAIQYSVLCAM